MAPAACPPVVDEVRKIMEGVGKDLTGENLKASLDKKVMNRLGSAFRKHLSDENKETYKNNAKTDKERCEWIAQFVIDPSVARLEGWNRDETYKHDKNKSEEHWLTEAQLGSPVWLNDPAHAATMIKSLLSRPHEDLGLAADGVKQYQYFKKKGVVEHGSKQTRGTSATAEMSDKDYAHVTDQLSKPREGTSAKRKPSKPAKEPETDENKRLKSATALRKATLGKCKAIIDKCFQDAWASEALLPKLSTDLSEKGDPSTMADWFGERIVSFRLQVTTMQENYGQEAIKTLERTPTLESLQESTRVVDSLLQSADAAHKAFKQSVDKDIRSLCN